MRNKSKFTIELDPQLHAAFKAYVARNKTNMRFILEMAIRKLLELDQAEDKIN